MSSESTESRVLNCIVENYGIRGSMERLAGENLNYLILSDGGMPYVVKIVDEDMPPAVVEMESQAVEHAIARGFSAQLPKIVENLNGNIETRINIRNKESNRLRIITYIDGIVLQKIPDISVKLLKNLGLTLAEFHLAMVDFRHPVARRSHRWNLAEAGQHEHLAGKLDDPARRELLAWAFGAWKQAEDGLESLRWQFIHGDMNPENILVEGDRVTGLVDFGDSGMNPTVCDLAICLAYLMMNKQNPLETAALVTDAYHVVRPLDRAERAAILPLVCGRLAVSIAISTERRAIDPGNPNWFGSESSAWDLLQVLRERAQSSSLGVL